MYATKEGEKEAGMTTCLFQQRAESQPHDKKPKRQVQVTNLNPRSSFVQLLVKNSLGTTF